jgi:hypothetical protein
MLVHDPLLPGLGTPSVVRSRLGPRPPRSRPALPDPASGLVSSSKTPSRSRRPDPRPAATWIAPAGLLPLGAAIPAAAWIAPAQQAGLLTCPERIISRPGQSPVGPARQGRLSLALRSCCRESVPAPSASLDLCPVGLALLLLQGIGPACLP